MPVENAIYTDVTADDSISGRDGFQFQAASAGFTAEDESRVISDGLFSPAQSWRSEHGDETTHPQQASFASHGGRLYFSRALALGQSLNGRPGNQLTAFAVAPSADDLAPYTPAQMLAADDWLLEKAQTRQPDAWVTPVGIDERFDDDALEQMARNDPWNFEALPAFVAMLRRSVDERGHRVFVQHDDLDTVLRWLALGTMLLDSETALKVTFRAFVADPWKGDFRVVGVHPELQRLEPSVDWKNVPTTSWIELDTRTLDDTTPGPLDFAAGRWLKERGAFDARNAVEIAHRLAPCLGDERAVHAAELIALGTDSAQGAAEIAADAIVALGRGGDIDALELYEEELLDALSTHQAENEDEFARTADAIAALLDAGLTEQALAVAGPALEALAAAPESACAFGQAVGKASSPLVWGDDDGRAAASDAWARSLNGARSMDLASMFAATGRLGLSLEGSLLERAVDRLAQQWASDPSLGAGREAWYACTDVEARVAEYVDAALTAGDEKQGRWLLDGVWDDLLVSPKSPLVPWKRVKEIALLPAAQRAAELRKEPEHGIPAASHWLILGPTLSPPHDAALIANIVRAGGVDSALSSRILHLLNEELNAPVPVGAENATRWAALFDALAEASPEDELADVINIVKAGRADRRRAIENAADSRSQFVRMTDAYAARLWALDDPIGTGRVLVVVHDHAAVQQLAGHLGDWASTTIDAYLAASSDDGRTLEAGNEILQAYEAVAEPLKAVLGGAARRFLDDHRVVERKARSNERMTEIIEQIRREHKGRSLLDRTRGWIRGGR
jgi:hypothetical protein